MFRLYGGIVRREAKHSARVWSVNFIFGRTIKGCSLNPPLVIYEFTRGRLRLKLVENIQVTILVGKSFELFAIRSVQNFIRYNNGPDFVSRRAPDFLKSVAAGTSYIEPDSPWLNGFVESVNTRFRVEHRNGEEFATLRKHVTSLITEGQVACAQKPDSYAVGEIE